MNRMQILAGVVLLALVSSAASQQEKPKEDATQGEARSDKLEPLKIQLPRPAFRGTPEHVPPGTRLEKPRKGPRRAFLAPKGVTNLAVKKRVTSSDRDPIIGDLELVADGDKEAQEGGYVELGPGVQYVQIDLGQSSKIFAILIWHYHANARVYHDVVVQTASDADFISDVRTLFNNDHDNSAGFGVGKDRGYWETYEGKLIDAKGISSRYLRFYSNGSTADDQNHYTEIEVYGLPGK